MCDSCADMRQEPYKMGYVSEFFCIFLHIILQLTEIIVFISYPAFGTSYKINQLQRATRLRPGSLFGLLIHHHHIESNLKAHQNIPSFLNNLHSSSCII